MSWYHPLVLTVIPLALLLIWHAFHRSRLGTSADTWTNIKRLWADRRGLSHARPSIRGHTRGLLLAVGALGTLVALARPQWGTIPETTFDQSREVLLALDLSRSMLADDVSPTRLERAKLLIESLLERLHGERVGLLVFAGTAFVQSPLSADYEVLRDFLPDLNPTYLPQGGTDYGALLRAATKAFGQTGDGDRFLIILSDGEAHDEAWKAALPALRARGIRVISLGIGTPAGALVPDGQGGLVKDDRGAAVLSRLEPATLQALATETGGAYRDAAAWVDLAQLLNATVEQGRKGRYVEQQTVRLQDRFQWFLAPALLFFLLSYWLELPVYPVARRVRLARPRLQPAPTTGVVASVLALCLLPGIARAGAAPAARTALEDAVAELAAKPRLTAPDCARLANETIAYASQAQTGDTSARVGVIDDALEAVTLGEHANPHAADWPALRERLQQLKAPLQQPPRPQHDQQQTQQPQDQSAKQENQTGSQGSGSASAGQQNQNTGGTSGASQRQRDAHSQDARSQSDKQDAGAESQGSDGRRGQHEDAKPAKADAGSEEQNTSAGAGKSQPNERNTADGDNQGDNHEAPERAADEPTALSSADAGFGDLQDTPHPQEPTDHQPQGQPATRLVGGGNAAATDSTDPSMLGLVGKMARVKDGDAPSVLFDRMNRAEGIRSRTQDGKNW